MKAVAVMRAGTAQFYRWGFAALIGALAMPVLPAQGAPAPEAILPAYGVWQEHSYRFEFVGYYSAYDCDGLAEKLRLLLKAAGARSDIRVVESCRVPGRPAGGAAVQLTFLSLQPANPGLPNSTAVHWRHVIVREQRPLQISSADCELVAQFRAELLPLFAVQDVADHTRCDPGVESPGAVHLEFDALAPAT